MFTNLTNKYLHVSVTQIVGEGKFWICTELYIQRSLPAQAPCALIYPALVCNRFLFLNTGSVLHSGWQRCRQINSSETPAASSHALILVLSTLELPPIWHTFYTSAAIAPSLHRVLHRELKQSKACVANWIMSFSQICTAHIYKFDKNYNSWMVT